MIRRGYILRLALFAAVSMGGHSMAFADMTIAKEVEAQKIYFDSYQHEINSDMEVTLDQTLSLLSRMNESYTLKLMGFTDSKGSDELNQDLSVQRANEVASYLISQGIDRNRILIQGMGSEQPIASNDTEEGRSENRRVEFKFISPDTSELKLVASTAPVITETAPVEPSVQEEVIEPAAEPAPVVAEPEPQAPEPAPPPPAKTERLPDTKPIELEPAKVDSDGDVVERDTMIAAQKKSKSGKKAYKHHIYDERKRNDEGQAYFQLMPLWLTMDQAQSLGAAEDRIKSQPSIGGEVGWTSFFEESYETYFSVRAHGAVIRFSQDAATLMAKQKDYTFGGELALGRFFHPNVSFQIQSGYSRELLYRNSGGAIVIDTDYLFHAGLSTEWVVWRFAQKGDVGFGGYYNYYDVGLDDFDFGSGYGLNIFVDYDFLRAGFNFNFLDLETETRQFNTWTFGPTIRLYF